ncbi:hypothetical protein D3C78_1395000 [compost metagenome]
MHVQHAANGVGELDPGMAMAPRTGGTGQGFVAGEQWPGQVGQLGDMTFEDGYLSVCRHFLPLLR